MLIFFQFVPVHCVPTHIVKLKSALFYQEKEQTVGECTLISISLTHRAGKAVILIDGCGLDESNVRILPRAAGECG